jgi:site-specific DNA-cytosine methylase
MADKSNCLMTSCQYYQYCGVLGYATPCEWDEDGRVTKAISGADGKVYTVYEVNDGFITIKGKQHPIKLVDGIYIIRKLTVSECKRLQTVPGEYEFPVSDSQAYKMLGNGWTVEVIAHLIRATQANEMEEEQLNLFKMEVF